MSDTTRASIGSIVFAWGASGEERAAGSAYGMMIVLRFIWYTAGPVGTWPRQSPACSIAASTLVDNIRISDLMILIATRFYL